jgi:hypothetical protein
MQPDEGSKVNESDIKVRVPLRPLDAVDEAVYERLTRREHIRPTDAPSVARLREHHLVEHDPHAPATPLSLDPRAAERQTVLEVSDRIIRDLTTLRDSAEAYDRLARIYGQQTAHDGTGVRVLETPDCINAAIGRSMSHLRSAIYTAQPNQRSAEVLDASRERDGGLLRRGIGMYTIYPQSARSREPEIRWAEEMSALGAHIRTSAIPFPRIILIEHVAAYLEAPLEDEHDGGVGPALEFTHPTAVAWVKALYMLWWGLAQPWAGEWTRGGDGEGTFTTSRERAIMRLLETDATRAAIARSLDVSERTVAYELSSLRRKFNVETEFALGTRWRDHPEYNLP